MFNSTDLLVKAMRYKIPSRNRHNKTKIFMPGSKKKTRYYLTDSDYYWDTYLESDHWKNLRENKLKNSPTCESCGTSNYLDIHHINYKNLYNVELADLKTLCRKCHTEEHNKKDITKSKHFKFKKPWHGRNKHAKLKIRKHTKYIIQPKSIFNTYVSIHY